MTLQPRGLNFPKMLWMHERPLSVARHYQVCSRPVYCRICDVTLEAIGSTPQEAEKHAVDMYSTHCAQFHTREH